MAQALRIHHEGLHFPRGSVRCPIELKPPPGFRTDDPSSWPRIEGRIEVVGGRMLYMPPSGDTQQDVCTALATVLGTWGVKGSPAFVVGTNEAGMILGGDARGADAAVWRASEAGVRSGKFRRVAPVLAVEVAGEEQGEADLREKARWYLDAGVETVWLLLPESREAVVLTKSTDVRCAAGGRLPENTSLRGLTVMVDDLFFQLDR